ncbi:MAG: RNB domain-containing ribonuclease [Peptococcaceae bacterium]|nr:RNB domain-containing ribonuclease [Peptococcaceae bacterium]
MKKPPITGTYETVGAFGRVIPHDRREIREVLILQGSELEARPGDQVVVELLPQASYRNIKQRAGISEIGKVVEVLGRRNDVAAAEKALIRRLGLREIFPPKVMEAAGRVGQTLVERDLKDRLDLRQELIVTIDGEDTRDIDDAISLTKKADGGWRLGVHIADVSHYVGSGSVLDKEAYLRGTSVYFPDAVLPMLPPALSNGICSLNPGEDRLAVSCLMELNEGGRLTGYQIFPTVIRSQEKLSYPQVQAFYNRRGFRTRDVLEGRQSPVEAAVKAADYFSREAVGDMLLDMAGLCLILRKNRLERGALDFELPECKIILNEDGGPEEIRRKHRMLSEMVIEEFMIMANETVAEHYRNKAVPFPYRIHSYPTRESLFALNQFLQPLGLFVKAERQPEGGARTYGAQGRPGGNKEGEGARGSRAKTEVMGFGVTPRSYQRLIQQIKGRPEESMVSTMLLRSLTHASYSPVEEGHFGLASDCYCHFTSPIRRYPDLMVHRIIKEYGMKGRPDKASAERQRERLEEQCGQASLCERAAEDAERKADNLWKAAYMSRFIGQEFDAIVSGVTGYGFYVALPNTVEGLVHVSTMEDYYEFDEKTQTLSSWRRHKSYRMGDQVRVRLTAVDVGAGYVDFELAEKGESKEKPQKPSAADNKQPDKTVGKRRGGSNTPRREKAEGRGARGKGEDRGVVMGDQKAERKLQPFPEAEEVFEALLAEAETANRHIRGRKTAAGKRTAAGRNAAAGKEAAPGKKASAGRNTAAGPGDRKTAHGRKAAGPGRTGGPEHAAVPGRTAGKKEPAPQLFYNVFDQGKSGFSAGKAKPPAKAGTAQRKRTEKATKGQGASKGRPGAPVNARNDKGGSNGKGKGYKKGK